MDTSQPHDGSSTPTTAQGSAPLSRRLHYPYSTKRRLEEIAVELMLACMASVPQGVISPTDHWRRAKEALEFGCQSAEDWGELVSTMCLKLQIPVLRSKSANRISSLGLEVVERETFDALCNLGRTEGIYLAALAQQARAEEREEEGERRRDEEPLAAQLIHMQEALDRATLERSRAEAKQRDAEENNRVLREALAKQGGGAG